MLDAWYSGLNRPELAEPDMRAELIENMGLFIFLSTAFNAIALVGFSKIFFALRQVLTSGTVATGGCWCKAE